MTSHDSKVCDHTSVGMMVWKDDKLLLIQRAKFPAGFALPAGHVDGDSTFEEAAKRELKEEVGLDTQEINLLHEQRKDNPCRREGGSWHLWKIFHIKPLGDIQRSKDETKKANWYTKEEIKELAKRTERYLLKEISEEAWEESPGLEPVMYELFNELEILS